MWWIILSVSVVLTLALVWWLIHLNRKRKRLSALSQRLSSMYDTGSRARSADVYRTSATPVRSISKTTVRMSKRTPTVYADSSTDAAMLEIADTVLISNADVVFSNTAIEISPHHSTHHHESYCPPSTAEYSSDVCHSSPSHDHGSYDSSGGDFSSSSSDFGGSSDGGSFGD